MQIWCPRFWNKGALALPNIDIYRYLNEQPTNNLNISTEKNGTKIKVRFSVDGKEIRYFDMKQMLCHLLGIATKHLQEPTSKRITFLYLTYDPTQNKLIDSEKGAKIVETYNTMCAECNAVALIRNKYNKTSENCKTPFSEVFIGRNIAIIFVSFC